VYLAIVNLRVATGKTTTAMHLAHALGETARTLLVDSDPRLRALTWAERSGQLGFQVLGLPTRDIHRRLPEIARGLAHVVIDSPPGDFGIVASSVLAAERVVVPASPGDLSALGPTLDLIRQVGTLSRTRVSVLLSRVTDESRQAPAARDVRRIGDADVMDARVPLLQWSGPPAGPIGSASAFGPVADELLELGAAREPATRTHRVRRARTAGAGLSRSR
jgi:chromosome partitioning protein